MHHVIISANTANWITLTKIVQLNALVVQKRGKKTSGRQQLAETNDLQMRPAQNKTLLNFYYLSTTLCTDTESENEEDRRSADDNETPDQSPETRRTGDSETPSFQAAETLRS